MKQNNIQIFVLSKAKISDFKRKMCRSNMNKLYISKRVKTRL